MIILYSIPFVTGFVLRFRGKEVNLSWLFSALAIPAIVLFDEFILPYRGGGASMWPIALVIGGLYGIVLGGLGVLTASFYLKKRGNTQQGH
jgi:hypothetical protein